MPDKLYIKCMVFSRPGQILKIEMLMQKNTMIIFFYLKKIQYQLNDFLNVNIKNIENYKKYNATE